jgi:hypothetical protein
MTILGESRYDILAVSAIAALLLTTNVDAQTNTQVGILKCTVAGGIGLLIGSRKALTCIFHKKNGEEERYEGKVSKLGVDIGITKKSFISWAVLAPSGKRDTGALAGRYVGVSAEATVVGGVGANLLVGGKSITLQPLSVQAQTGLNIAGGIGSIKLNYISQ